MATLGTLDRPELTAGGVLPPPPQIGRLKISRLDTADIPEQDQFSQWREMAANLGNVHRAPGQTGAFRAATSSFGAGGLIYSHHKIDDQCTFDRTRSVVSRFGADALAIQYRRRGVEVENSFGNGQLFGAGTIRITGMDEPFYSRNLNYENLAIVVPYSLLDARLPGVRGLHGTVLQPGPMTSFLKNHMWSALETLPYVSAAEVDQISDVTLETLAASLMRAVTPTVVEADFMDAPVLRTVRHFIDANLHRSELNPDSIAHAVGVSRAKLYRVCQPYGAPMELVLQRRLRRAMGLLRHGGMSVTMVAFEVGFENRETFSRAFRRAFGLSARDFMHSYRLSGPKGT